jgi:AcrR family transcriptional regulator
MAKDSRRMVRPASRRAGRLTAEAWERAALDALAREGVGAAAVEPLARRLGVTKGSFYWHFRDREALLRAALRRWEREGTDQVIESLARMPNAAARLVRLITGAFEDPEYRRVEAGIHAASQDPVVRTFVRRVWRRRLESTETIYRQIGLAPADARSAAILAYSAFQGLLALEWQSGQNGLTPAEMRRYVEYLLRRLVPDT